MVELQHSLGCVYPTGKGGSDGLQGGKSLLVAFQL